MNIYIYTALGLTYHSQKHTSSCEKNTEEDSFLSFQVYRSKTGAFDEKHDTFAFGGYYK